MVDEMSTLHKSGTWELVSLPAGKSMVGCRWVMRSKFAQTVRLIGLTLALLPMVYSDIWARLYRHFRSCG